jgi:hypothetical protein
MSAAAAALLLGSAPLSAQPYGIGQPGDWTWASRADAKPGGSLTGSHSTYVHMLSRDASSGKVTVETATVFEEEQKGARAPFWQVKAETVFDCRAKTYRFIRLSFYDKPANPGARADLLWSVDFTPAEQEVTPVQPETTAGDAMKIACG